MAFVELKDVCADFPIYDSNTRSLKKRLFQVATGGQFGADQHGRLIVRALEDVSFTFNDGDRVGLIGHNGSGKSTLLRLLCGVYEPSHGAAVIDGEVGSLIDISLGIDPEATGRENIFIRGGFLGMSRAEVSSQLDKIIAFSELGDFIDMPMRTYSSGMQLRLAFSVSTIVRPEIVLMDEWLSVGDESFQHKAEDRLKELLQATSILVIASHSRDLVARVCNRVIWLEHGKIRADSSPQAVLAEYFGGAA